MRYYLPRKPTLTLASLGGLSEFAELSSRYKASHVRLMIWWLARKSQQVADASSDTDLQVLATCVWGLQRSTEIQTYGGLILSQQDADEACETLLTFTNSFAWLALRFHDQGYLFKMRPKLHYLAHAAADLKKLRLNQLKLFATHCEESFLGKIKLIAQQVHGRTLVQRTLQRYILGLAISIHRFNGQPENR
eukprot:Skav225796  [mRNA]  locus=scaffold396:170247:170822:- [translate_table: standard]